MDIWSAWYSQADQRSRGQHDDRFEALEVREAYEWREPLSKALKGNSKALVEIRVTGDVEWRLLGYFGPKGERHVFTFLLICHHKGKIYAPPDALKTAVKRMKAIEAGKAKVRRCARPK